VRILRIESGHGNQLSVCRMTTKIERRLRFVHVHVDRRKTDEDVFEHVIRGVRRDHFRLRSTRPVVPPKGK
jgi:hypothetical protein